MAVFDDTRRIASCSSNAQGIEWVNGLPLARNAPDSPVSEKAEPL